MSLLAQGDYHPEGVLSACRRLLSPLGGMEHFVPPGSRVLLKPNLVLGRDPGRAVNTHPALVRAVAILAREAGASWLGLGDSPGIGSVQQAIAGAGLLPVVEELELDVVEFTPTVVRTTGVFPRLELAAEVMTADVLINLPKLKTHAQMFLSLAVKNLFGTVPGARKLQWHYRAGRDRLVFARMLNAVAQAGRPALSLVDAVWGMDSYGPTSGRARPVGFLAAGADPWAVDAVLMDVLGIERQRLFTLADASQNGPHGWETALAVGDSPEKLRPADWRLPELTTLQMHGRLVEHYLPGLASWLRERLAPPPYAGEGCDSCGTCRRLCPAGAIRGEGGKPEFDSRLCLRCYCCHELCPRGAMKITRGGLIQRLLGIAGED